MRTWGLDTGLSCGLCYTLRLVMFISLDFREGLIKTSRSGYDEGLDAVLMGSLSRHLISVMFCAALSKENYFLL